MKWVCDIITGRDAVKDCSQKCVKWTGAWKGHDQEWGMQGVVSPRESTERE